MDVQLWERRGPRIPPAAPAAAYAIYPVSAAEVMELLACDQARMGRSRGPLLARLMADHPHAAFVAVRRADGVFCGHVFRARDAIGPLVADAPEAAAWLLHAIEGAGAPPRALVPAWNRGASSMWTAAGYAPAGAPRAASAPPAARADAEFAVVDEA